MKYFKIDDPKILKFLIRLSTGALMFIIAFTVSNTKFFEEHPIFEVRFLAEILIGLAAFLFGYHTIPIFAKNFVKWFEEFVTKQINKIVWDFWDQQSRRLTVAKRTKQKKKRQEEERKNKEDLKSAVLLDTSILIDGRILDILKSGFVDAEIVVPQGVLDELHLLSDSADDLKRQRGRRGLDLLNQIKESYGIRIFESIGDISKEKGVDKELLRLAKKYKMKVMTVDFNLNKVAKAEGLGVLNVNELANAVKTNLLPGESVKIKIVQKGKEKGQGVGYLEDGTMIVVLGAEGMVGKKVSAVVSRIIQTEAGKMVFCELLK